MSAVVWEKLFIEKSCRMNTIYFVLDHIEISGLDSWLASFVEKLKTFETRKIKVTSDPHKASLIIFLGSGIIRNKMFSSNHIKQHSLYKRYRDRCFIWCTEDKPLDYLPGLYASLPKSLFKADRHRSFTYYCLPTENIPVSKKLKRDITYSFVGGETSVARKTLFDMSHPSSALVEKKANFNHGNPATEDNKKQFAEILQRSCFTLCPRGVGTSSYRLFEAMRFGSIPVIISDELVLPDGPDWQACSISIPERDISRLQDILLSQTKIAAMSELVSHYYRLYFSTESFLNNIVRLTSAIKKTYPTSVGNWNFYQSQVRYINERLEKRLARYLT